MGKCINKCVVVLWVNAEWKEAALSNFVKCPLLYIRYLDDIRIIWPHSKVVFWNFMEILNQHDDNIKLKATISDHSVDIFCFGYNNQQRYTFVNITLARLQSIF